MYDENECCAQEEHGSGLSPLFENGYCRLVPWGGLEVAIWRVTFGVWVWALVGVGTERVGGRGTSVVIERVMCWFVSTLGSAAVVVGGACGMG